jgi:hypothetical protein
MRIIRRIVPMLICDPLENHMTVLRKSRSRADGSAAASIFARDVGELARS